MITNIIFSSLAHSRKGEVHLVVSVCCYQTQYSSEERVRAACVIQAAWKAHQTRCRLKKLPRAVSALQRSFRYRLVVLIQNLGFTVLLKKQ